MVTHWFFAIPRYVNQLLPLPPPFRKHRNTGQVTGNKRWDEGYQATYVHSCVDSDAFHLEYLISYQEGTGNNIFRK